MIKLLFGIANKTRRFPTDHIGLSFSSQQNKDGGVCLCINAIEQLQTSGSAIVEGDGFAEGTRLRRDVLLFIIAKDTEDIFL